MKRTAMLLGTALLLAAAAPEPSRLRAEQPKPKAAAAGSAKAEAEPNGNGAAKKPGLMPKAVAAAKPAPPNKADAADQSGTEGKSHETGKPAPKGTGAKAPAGLVAKGPKWLASLAEAEGAARKTNRPLLVKVDASFCVWCRKLDESFAEVEATKLAEFVLVKLDAGRDADDARRLGVSGTPAMRVLSPLGRLVASHDGYLPADALTAWLTESRNSAKALPEADLASASAPGALEAVRIVRVLKLRDVALREAALVRLRPFPKETAPATIAAFREGNLQTRLAVLELLRAWKAPTEGLDPWRPETITKERLAGVDAWVRTTVDGNNPAPWKPTPAELAAAEREIDGLATAGEAEAAERRERLAKFGAHLLPSVTARLKSTDDEMLRERLSALRYRLVAAPARVLDWPGGVERLASRDLDERRRAVDELARRAQSYDEALLLELFGDPDPLVRELSLRGLQTAAGEAANVALVKLLNDPEPNVRAAVLKQWAEKPSPQLLPELKKYVAVEQDADLLVHAVRVLREMKANTSGLLIGLMKHEAWQVRAEATEALAARVKDRSDGMGDQTDAFKAFVERLDDPDGFVAARAVEGLRNGNSTVDMKRMMKLAKNRPELAPAVIDVVVNNEEYRKLATESLREFAKHADPAVRAAAIAGLTHDATVDAEKELLTALADPEAQVRIAAAGGVWNRASASRNQVNSHVVVMEVSEPSLFSRMARSVFGGGETARPAEPEKKETKPKGKEPPEAALLRKMLAGDEQESTAAAKALASIGLVAEVIDRLEAAVRKEPKAVHELAEVLPAVDSEFRVRLFRTFVEADPNEAVGAAYQLSQAEDERTPELMWSLVRDPRLRADRAFGMVQPLQQAYLGRNYYNAEQASPAGGKRLKSEATARLKQGGPLERALALSLLAVAVPEERVAAATDVLAVDLDLGTDLRELALRIVLLASGKAEADRAAVWALESDDPSCYGPALALLARDYQPLMYWKDHGYFLSNLRDHLDYRLRDNRASSSNPFDPVVPQGLKSEHLRRAARNAEPQQAAYVAYFRVLLDETEDVRPLVELWEKEPDDSTFRRLLVRAIAYLDDAANVPILERISASIKDNTGEVGDFYWTIRIMHGPEVLDLRKRIRDEVGIERLNY